MHLCKYFIFPLLNTLLMAQIITNTNALNQFALDRSNQFKLDRQYALDFALNNNISAFTEFTDGTAMEIVRVQNNIPVYYLTTNLGGAKTVRTDKLWPTGTSGLNLTGNGYNKMGKWDGGRVLLTHQEFHGRVFQIDSPSTLSTHATHVAGSLIATGIDPNAKGMAFEAYLDDYDWVDDEAEMATAAGNGMEISNHSYVTACGWFYNTWFGDVNISTTEDYKFGYYSIYTYYWDNIAYNAPYYLIVKAAGNDRGEDCTAETCYVWIDGEKVINTEYREPDGGTDGYDCIPEKGVAKNILTVGAITELLEYTEPNDVMISNFSSWGPADDGRIKPDLVAKGVAVYSTDSDANDDYTTYSGTSMATPAVTGSLVLLQKYYQDTHSAKRMRSATLKALAIHTANEAGVFTGPDYIHGWGLLNSERAAELITYDSYGNNVIDEQILNQSETYTREINVSGTESLKVTICWTDPPAVPLSTNLLNNRYSMLKNDLDLKIKKNGTIYYPWKLDPDNPSNPATNFGENNVDNVEQVFIPSPSEGTYVLEITHDGSLYNGQQAFSIIIGGNVECINGSVIYNSATNKFNFCEDGVWVEK